LGIHNFYTLSCHHRKTNIYFNWFVKSCSAAVGKISCSWSSLPFFLHSSTRRPHLFPFPYKKNFGVHNIAPCMNNFVCLPPRDGSIGTKVERAMKKTGFSFVYLKSSTDPENLFSEKKIYYTFYRRKII